MTLEHFNRLLHKVDPRLHIRWRGYDDIVGLFYGNEYLCRMTKGEFNYSGYRMKYFMADDFSTHYGNIQKRGRKTIVKVIEQRGLIKTVEQRAMLLWGIEPKSV